MQLSPQLKQDTIDAETIERDSGQDGLSKIIDEMAYHFWRCGRCLSMAPDTVDCSNRSVVEVAFIMDTSKETVLVLKRKATNCGSLRNCVLVKVLF